MKIIFLDIDGVLVTARSHLGHQKYGGLRRDFDPMVAGILCFFCEKYGAKIVITSTWRVGAELNDFELPVHRNTLYRNLRDTGMLEYLHQDWKTPILNGCRGEDCIRGDEIDAWLHTHPDTTAYAIIDDDCDMREDQMDRFIHITGQDGFLMYPHYAELVKLLGLIILNPQTHETDKTDITTC